VIYVDIELWNAACACALVTAASLVSAATAVPVLASKPAATSSATFLGDMKFIVFSPVRSCV
jgi:hypothetical protein